MRELSSSTGRQRVRKLINEVGEVARACHLGDLDRVSASKRVVGLRPALCMGEHLGLCFQHQAEPKPSPEHLKQRTGDNEAVVGARLVLGLNVRRGFRSDVSDEPIELVAIHPCSSVIAGVPTVSPTETDAKRRPGIANRALARFATPRVTIDELLFDGAPEPLHLRQHLLENIDLARTDKHIARRPDRFGHLDCEKPAISKGGITAVGEDVRPRTGSDHSQHEHVGPEIEKGDVHFAGPAIALASADIEGGDGCKPLSQRGLA